MVEDAIQCSVVINLFPQFVRMSVKHKDKFQKRTQGLLYRKGMCILT